MDRILQHHRRHRAFSFVEVLFAVILLGIGFIMIAGIFPVAIQQSTTSAQETAGTAICRDAIRQIQSIADTQGAGSLFAPTGASFAPLVSPVNQPLATAVGSTMYQTSDRRFGWSGFYSHAQGSPFIQVIVISLENDRFRDAKPGDADYNIAPPLVTNPSASAYTAASQAAFASPVRAQFAYSTTSGASYAYISNDNVTTAGQNPCPNAATGTFLVVSDDTPAGYATPGIVNGRIYRLGNLIASPTDGPQPPPQSSSTPPFLIYQLQPGNDLKPDPTSSANPSPEQTPSFPGVRCYIFGRAPDLSGNMTGSNQDITVMSAMIRVNSAGN